MENIKNYGSRKVRTALDASKQLYSHANESWVDDPDPRNASRASQILARNIPTNMSILYLERYFGRFGTIENIKLSFCPRLQV